MTGEFVIGRSSSGEGKLGDDPELSRQHARLTRGASNQLTIEDLGSTNGTFVNGTRISAPQELKLGDKVKLGTTTIEVRDASGNVPQATAMAPVQTDPVPPPPAAPAQPAAPAPLPARQPFATPPAAPPPAPTGPGVGRRIAAIGGGLLVLAAIAVGIVVLAGGGDDDGGGESETLATPDLIQQNRRSTVLINTRGPARDDDGNRVVASGGGTGIVINAQRGLVLTNAHVVAGATSVAAVVGGQEVNARVVGSAPCDDLAVVELNTPPSGLVEAELGASKAVRAGDEVIALGYPGAFEEDVTQRKLQATEGTVSSGTSSFSLGGTLPDLRAAIQHQAPISPGNSGGPLFNRQGQVIGINTLAAVAASERQNQNGAIAIDRAKAVLPALQRGEFQGYVGWDLVPIDDDTDFLFVQAVDAGSPAAKANLVFGDAIVEVDDTPVTSIPELCDILGSKAEGDQVKVAGVTIPTSQTFVVNVRLTN